MDDTKNTLFLVELSEKSDSPFSIDQAKNFCFCYSARIPEDLVVITNYGKQSVWCLERETLKELEGSFPEDDHMADILETFRMQLAVGPVVFLATSDVLDGVTIALGEDETFSGQYFVYPRDSGREDLRTYYVGIPLLQDGILRHDRYRVRFELFAIRNEHTVPL